MFKGYLLNNKQGGNLNKYIQYDTYECTPDQREEIIAYRDDNTRDLTRVTAVGTKTKITFMTTTISLADKIAVQSFFNDCMVDTLQRKVRLEFWDDEKNEYRTGFFYMPDMVFKIQSISENDIRYNPYKVTLIEY